MRLLVLGGLVAVAISGAGGCDNDPGDGPVGGTGGSRGSGGAGARGGAGAGGRATGGRSGGGVGGAANPGSAGAAGLNGGGAAGAPAAPGGRDGGGGKGGAAGPGGGGRLGTGAGGGGVGSRGGGGAATVGTGGAVGGRGGAGGSPGSNGGNPGTGGTGTGGTGTGGTSTGGTGTGGTGTGGSGCGACVAPANGTAMCISTSCQIGCNTGYHLNANLCDPNNTAACCGPTCKTCTATRTNATAACSGPTGDCVSPSPCATGYHDCSGTCQKNDDVAHCGPSCLACATRPNTSAPTCDGTQCVYTCQGGFDACDGNKGDANGCEVNLQTDASHCGSCPKVCAAATNATGMCGGGTCGLTCNRGFGNCNTTAADGCEVDLKTNLVHCGRCNTTHPNATSGDLGDQVKYDANAGPPSCRLWLSEQCIAKDDARVAICCDPDSGPCP